MFIQIKKTLFFKVLACTESVLAPVFDFFHTFHRKDRREISCCVDPHFELMPICPRVLSVIGKAAREVQYPFARVFTEKNDSSTEMVMILKFLDS